MQRKIAKRFYLLCEIITSVLSMSICSTASSSNQSYERISGRSEESQTSRITTVSSATAKELETMSPTNLQLETQPICYDYNLGCFRVGNLMTHSQGLPRNPKDIGTTMTLFWKDIDGAVLSTTMDYTLPMTTQRGSEQFTTEKALKILVHGFDQSGRSEWITQATKALVGMDCNVLVVDWSKGHSRKNAEQSAKDTAMVARQLSVLVVNLAVAHPETVLPGNIHAIGFSMGAHLVGFFGRHFESRTNKKIGRVTGLDPAAPFFQGVQTHLTKDDAVFVDVIHTSVGESLLRGKVGFKAPIGHVDFYPNGGVTQPGCRLTTYPCSHQRAWRLFVSSLQNIHCHFRSWPCPGGVEEAIAERCKSDAKSANIGRMGYYAAGTGVQFLYTSSNNPYCLD